MAPRSPLITAIGIGLETTPGTAVARTVWIIPVSVSGFVEQPTYKNVDTLRAGVGAGPSHSDVIRLNTALAGRIVVPFTYDGLGLLLTTAMMSAVATTGGGPYTHAYERGTTIQHLTIELIRGDSARSELLVGCSIPSFKITGQQGKEVMLDLEVNGFKADADRAAAGSPTFVAFAALGTNIAAEDDAGDLNWNSVNHPMHRSFTLNVDNGHKEIRKVGSRTVVSVIRATPAVETLTVARLEDGDVLYNHHRKNDVAGQDLSIALDGPGNLFAQIILRNARITGYPPQGISAGDGIAENVVWTGYQDGTDSALLIQIINDSSSGVAN
jgi:hypothetical protein